MMYHILPEARIEEERVLSDNLHPKLNEIEATTNSSSQGVMMHAVTCQNRKMLAIVAGYCISACITTVSLTLLLFSSHGSSAQTQKTSSSKRCKWSKSH